MAVTSNPEERNYIIWQELPEDMGNGEPAMHIKGYSDCIVLNQEGRTIHLNYETVNEFCKILKKLKTSNQ